MMACCWWEACMEAKRRVSGCWDSKEPAEVRGSSTRASRKYERRARKSRAQASIPTSASLHHCLILDFITSSPSHIHACTAGPPTTKPHGQDSAQRSAGGPETEESCERSCSGAEDKTWNITDGWNTHLDWCFYFFMSTTLPGYNRTLRRRVLQISGGQGGHMNAWKHIVHIDTLQESASCRAEFGCFPLII